MKPRLLLKLPREQGVWAMCSGFHTLLVTASR